MRVTDQDTGHEVILDSTPELERDLAPFREPCGHAHRELRQRRNKGGAIQYIEQCSTCGKSVGMFRKHSDELVEVPAWDWDIEERHSVTLNDQREAVVQKHVRIQRGRSEGFWKAFNKYLESDSWRQRRSRVMKRASGQCEGCQTKPATQVHHLTYDHVFEEFLFELVAICDECHARLHRKSPYESVCDGCRHQTEEHGVPWCFISDTAASDALSVDGDCGPKRSSFEPLR